MPIKAEPQFSGKIKFKETYMNKIEKLQADFANFVKAAEKAKEQILVEKDKADARAKRQQELKKERVFALVDGEWLQTHQSLVPAETATMRIVTMEVDGFYGAKVVAENLPNIVPMMPLFIPSHKTYNGFLLRNGYKYDNGEYIKESAE